MAEHLHTPNLNRAGRRATARKSRRTRAGAALTAGSAALATAAIFVGPAASPLGAATTLTVNSLANAGDGTCDATCTLRDALLNAVDGDTIVFQAGLTGDIPLATELPVAASVDIQGPGPDVIGIDGQNAVRIFNVSIGGGASGSFTISGLTLKNANGAGGAILDANEDLTATNVAFINNHSTGDGGAIHATNPGTTMNIADSVFTDNDSVEDGGAIAMSHGDAFTITNTAFTDNDAGPNYSGGALYLTHLNGPIMITGTSITKSNAGYGAAAAIWYNEPDVTIDHSSFTFNTSTNGDGGALYFYQMNDVTISNSNVSQNTAASGNGGGIKAALLEGDLTITNSTIAGNQSDSGGGGIAVDGGEGVAIGNSTISGNTAGDNGGGIALYGPNDAVNIFNSTISGNIAGTIGGGIFFAGYYGLNLTQSTVTANDAARLDGIALAEVEDAAVQQAPQGPPGNDTAAPTHSGAHTAVDGDTTGTVTATGTILWGNGGTGGTDIGTIGTLTSKNSLLGTATGTTIVDSGGTITGKDPLLGPLADNGGPTQTHALLAGSPAIDAGEVPVATFPNNDNDQRGPGYPRVVAGIVDIGAYEVQPIVITPTFTG